MINIVSISTWNIIFNRKMHYLVFFIIMLVLDLIFNSKWQMPSTIIDNVIFPIMFYLVHNTILDLKCFVGSPFYFTFGKQRLIFQMTNELKIRFCCITSLHLYNCNWQWNVTSLSFGFEGKSLSQTHCCFFLSSTEQQSIFRRKLRFPSIL